MKHQRDAPGHWVSGLSDPTVALRRFLESHDELLRHQARRLGMNTTDMHTLRLLDVHGPLGPAELARRLDLRSASVTVLLDRLEASGLVERVRDTQDRRRVTVRVLAHAAEHIFDVWAPFVRAMDDVSRGLTPSEQRAVCVFFDRIAEIAGS